MSLPIQDLLRPIFRGMSRIDRKSHNFESSKRDFQFSQFSSFSYFPTFFFSLLIVKVFLIR